MPIDVSLFLYIGIILIASTMLLYITKALKQPSILAYVLAGVIIGPLGLRLVTGETQILSLGELGVAFLLFGVGLEIDFKALKDVGFAAITGGIVQILLMLAFGFFMAFGLGYGFDIGLYIGLLLAFSSTMIVTKILVDRDEIKSIHGRIMIGILILQDIVAIAMLAFIGSMEVASMHYASSFIFNGLILFALAIVLNKFVFSKVFDYAARSHEILFLTALSALFGFIGLSYYLGFSIAIGAFIAGLSMANFPYNVEISGEARALRDFFSIIFFATLGMQVDVFSVWDLLPLFVISFAGLVVLKPILLFAIYTVMGYGKRVATSVGIGLGQGSEFFFIIASQAVAAGLLKHEVYSVPITLIVISMITTPYMMKLKNRIYHVVSRLNRHMSAAPISKNMLEDFENEPKRSLRDHVVIFGCHRMGSNIIKYLSSINEKFIVVDQDPHVLKEMKKRGVFCIYGDAENTEVLKKANIAGAKIIVSTIPDIYSSSFIITKTRRKNKKAKIIARAHSKEEAIKLYKAGADFVLIPEFVTANEIVKFMSQFLEK